MAFVSQIINLPITTGVLIFHSSGDLRGENGRLTHLPLGRYTKPLSSGEEIRDGIRLRSLLELGPQLLGASFYLG